MTHKNNKNGNTHTRLLDYVYRQTCFVFIVCYDIFANIWRKNSLGRFGGSWLVFFLFADFSSAFSGFRKSMSSGPSRSWHKYYYLFFFSPNRVTISLPPLLQGNKKNKNLYRTLNTSKPKEDKQSVLANLLFCVLFIITL